MTSAGQTQDRGPKLGDGRCKVLIADDSKSQLMLAQRMVESWGFETITAVDGGEAVRKFQSEDSLHLAIIDWQMPIMDGLQVIEQIKASGRLVHTLMLTAKTETADLKLAFAAGADDYIRKPFHAVELQARLMSGQRLIEAQMNLAHAQKLESIGQLAAGIAHEINTPAQYVGDNVEFLEESFGELGELIKKYQALHSAATASGVLTEFVTEVDEAAARADLEFLTEEIPRALAQSRDGIGRVAKIVLAMKDFSHPGSDEKQPVDLNRAIESTVTVAKSEWKYVANLELELDPSLPRVPCLAGELNQVVLNIVVNAAHALAERGGEEKGQIRIRTCCDADDWALIEISDTGAGMSEAVRCRVFDPFFTTKEVGKGTGQGLAIARAVVVGKHAGTIEVESELGRGTTFRIRLPLCSEPFGHDEAAS